MIVSFSVQNWMSFRDEVTFSMLASKERQHGERLPRVAKYKMRLLPVSAIYGGNASGKTNFFKALNFAQSLVVKGTQPDSMVGVESFRLDSACAKKPSRFSFELLINEKIYEFSFALTRKEIVEERLVEILSTSEKVLYERKNGSIEFDPSLQDDQFLEFAFRGTRDNQLFLTNCAHQKVERFKPVYNWFKNDLILIAPDSRFAPFEQFFEEDHPLYETLNTTLSQLDTGISSLGGENVPFDNLPLPDALKEQLQEEVQEGMSVRIMSDPKLERFVVSRKDGELVAKKLISFHDGVDGKRVKFDIRHESDGSQRLIDLLPAFLEVAEQDSKKVYIIDEVDRSLHTLLTRQLLEGFLSSCSKETRSQLLFTTHDALLMDQDLLRRDEMWVAERDCQGVSSLMAFSDYKDVRYDKDIRKSYLQGRLGGIPHILPVRCGQKPENKRVAEEH
jgi:hypothetical protein